MKERLKFQKRIGLIVTILFAFIAILCFASGTWEGMGAGIGMMTVPIIAWKKNDKFTELSPEELKNLTDAELVMYRKDERQHYLDAFKSTLNAEQKALLEAEIGKFESKFAKTSDIEELKSIMQTISDKIKNANNTSISNRKELHEKEVDRVKKLLKTAEFNKEIEYKADTVRASITDFETMQQLPGIGRILMPSLSIQSLLASQISAGTDRNDGGTIRYFDWDEATTVRAAKALAEGDTFDESTAKWKTYFASYVKVGDSIPASEELFEDNYDFGQELDTFLADNIDREIEDEMYSGAGGTELTGLYTMSPSFNHAGYAGKKISDANEADLLLILKNDISKRTGVIPNFAIVDWDTYLLWGGLKNADGDYIQVSMHGLNIVPSYYCTSNTMVIGNTQKIMIRQKSGLIISKLPVGTQFTDDMFTIKGRKRLFLNIRNVDRKAFLRVTDVTAAVAAVTA